MALKIVTSAAPVNRPQYIEKSRIVQAARNNGNPNADKADGVTIPRLTTDQRGLEYEQRKGRQGLEFRFNRGELKLKLAQEIYINKALNACARKAMLVHENGHVRDNEKIVKNKLPAAISKEAFLKSVFEDRKWFPRSSFQDVQKKIQAAVGGLFSQLTGAAVRQHDTAQEYKRLKQKIDDCYKKGR